MKIEIFENSISANILSQLAKESFGDWVKAVVDVQERIIAIGGDLHADAEELLLKKGSQQENLWGINIYLNRGKEERIVYESFINIRPRQNNQSMIIQDPKLKLKIKEIVDALLKDHD